ncbi:venom prothrombin activator omicarin-C catalytic subunit-like [Leguminivora glycinivorella]|uniref:venom prothrombin activator omicarin-C catalytic subunit-like n=1 Tax=Leguminivora glycinivorella TaxID=1035111 RepID=UPI00200E083A|nr:venom prothrombin activator omicarin-C catalytic subunit-like [Leguminivora glycinivorella]
MSGESIAACGGTLISSQTVLTAAHCLDDVTRTKKYISQVKYAVYMGHRLHRKATMRREMQDYTTHENYDTDDVYFDIGVMFLNRPVQFSSTIKKALLMTREMGRHMGREGGLAVAGWGKFGEETAGSEFLKTLKQTLLDQELCYLYINETERAPGIICGAKRGQVNSTEYAFSGDSGGPLARPRDQRLAGLVSWRMESFGVTVYTSVPYFYDWIEATQFSLFRKNCPKRG